MSNEGILPGFDEEVNKDLKIRLKKLQGKKSAIALELIGSIDAYNVDYLRRSVMKVIEAGFIFLTFALGRVDMVSSSGVATFISLNKVINETGGELILDNMTPKVKGVFSLLCLETFFHCTDPKDE
jgi:anti-anti-sigma factor